MPLSLCAAGKSYDDNQEDEHEIGGHTWDSEVDMNLEERRWAVSDSGKARLEFELGNRRNHLVGLPWKRVSSLP